MTTATPTPQLTQSGLLDAGAHLSSGTGGISAGDMLTGIFGEIAQNPMHALTSFNSGDTVLSTIFLYLNIGLMTLGSIWISYKTLAAATQTAHDGEFIGKSFHSTWIPIRVGAGIMSLIPVAGGWNALQVIMLWIVMLGAGLGNMTWEAVVNQWSQGAGAPVGVNTPTGSNNFSDAAKKMFSVALCDEAQKDLDGASLNQPSAASILFKDPSSYFSSPGCGEISVRSSMLPQIQSTSVYSPAQSSNGVLNLEVESVTKEAVAQELSTMRALAAQAIMLEKQNALDAISQTSTSATPPNLVPIIEQRDREADVFARTLAKKISATGKDFMVHNPSAQLMSAAAHDYGFVSAGAFYTTYARALDEARSAVNLNGLVSVSLPPQGEESTAGMPSYYSSLRMRMDAAQTVLHPVKTTENSTSENSVFTMLKDKMGLGEKAISSFIQSDSNKPALLNLKDTADWVVSLGEVGLTVAGALSGTLQNPLGALVGGAASGWLHMLQVTFELSIGFFLMVSIFVPLIPFVVFMGQVVEWLVSAVIAVCAAPFLGFAHFDTDGEGLGQKTAFGYTFMLSAFVRPLLLVLGFVVSAALIEVSIQLLTRTFMFAVSDAQINSVTGLLSIFGFAALYLVLAVGFINASCSVMHILPDTILRFMGAESSNLGIGKNIAASATGGTLVGKQLIKAGGGKPAGAASAASTTMGGIA